MIDKYLDYSEIANKCMEWNEGTLPSKGTFKVIKKVTKLAALARYNYKKAIRPYLAGKLRNYMHFKHYY